MSVLIGSVKGPHHNSPNDVAEVWCSPNRIEFTLHRSADSLGISPGGASRSLDPIAARNLAALLVRASEEAERMAIRQMLDRVNETEPRRGKSASLCLEHGGVGYRENCTECQMTKRLVDIAAGKGVTVP